MNVLVVNQQEEILTPLNLEIIKTLRGTFSSEELISTFTNFFFARMIIDITALQNSEDIVTYQKLSIGLPIDKIILLIPANSVVASNAFLSKLISMGYYNFTTNGDGIVYLLNTPNTYKEVAYLHQNEPAAVPGVMPQNNQSGFYGEQQNNQNGFYSEQQNSFQPTTNYSGPKARTIGVMNVTNSSGATSLIYMMKRELEQTFNLSVLAMEVDKRDFNFFREENMVSTSKSSLASEIMNSVGYACVLVDLNDYDDQICDDVLYLIEPSVIKLNKLMLRDKAIFSKLKGKKVIINKSTLSEADVKEFSIEAGIDIFYVIPPLNDRERSNIIVDLLKHLGF